MFFIIMIYRSTVTCYAEVCWAPHGFDVFSRQTASITSLHSTATASSSSSVPVNAKKFDVECDNLMMDKRNKLIL